MITGSLKSLYCPWSCQFITHNEQNIVCNNGNKTIFYSNKSETFKSLDEYTSWYESSAGPRKLIGQLGKDDFSFHDYKAIERFTAKQLVFVRGLLLSNK